MFVFPPPNRVISIRPYMNKPLLCAVVALLGVGTLASVAICAETPPAKISLRDFPATTVDNVVVPVPSEVFNALEKMGTVAWRSELRPSFTKQRNGRPQIALLMGTVIADGFLAVQAQDGERVKEIGRTVLDLARDINVRDVVLAHCNSIIEAADRRDWKMVRKELDKTQQDVRQAMDQLKDQELSQLVSIGGWLRGTEALTALVKKDYTADRAELLAQPGLVNLFEKQISGMSPRLKNTPLLGKIQTGLTAIRPLVSIDTAISKQSVDTIHSITRELVRAISPNDS
jgi:hypothetical protein